MTELFTAPLKFYNLSEFAACCLELPPPVPMKRNLPLKRLLKFSSISVLVYIKYISNGLAVLAFLKLM